MSSPSRRRPVGVDTDFARRIEEGMACARVAVKLMVLAELLEDCLGAVDLIRTGVLVIVSEYPEERRR